MKKFHFQTVCIGCGEMKSKNDQSDQIYRQGDLRGRATGRKERAAALI